MPAIVTLVYPAVEFDLKYYLDSHMARIQQEWGNQGLIKWQVVQLDPSSGSCTQCIMEWESTEIFQKLVASESGIAITADMKNYTAGAPTIYVGEVVGGTA